MRFNRPVAASAAILTAMAVTGFASGLHEAPETSPVVVDAADVAPVALPSLTFKVGQYMENRVSDHVDLPPGTVLQFTGLPPGLSYDQGTTAIKGVPTRAGTYHPSATAYIAGIPVRTESTTVTITGGGGANPAPAPAQKPAPTPNPAPAPAPGAPAPAPGAAAPAPGTINIADIEGLALPQPVKDALLGAALQINGGIQAAWDTVPAGSAGK